MVFCNLHCIHGDCTTIGAPISAMYEPVENDVVLGAFSGKRFVCCAPTIICNIYSTVGRSTANIYDRGVIFTEVQSAEVNMLTEVGYRGYRPTYRAIYNIFYGECTTGDPFESEGQKTSMIDAIFCSSLSDLYGTLA